MTQIRFWRYPEEFRRTAVDRFRSCENIVHLAKDLNVPRQTLYQWNEESEREFGDEFATEKSRESRLRREVHHLKRLLAEKALETDFFKGALQRVEARCRESCASGGPTSTTTSGA
jgi:transposase-like protein